ncbi:hypothetical protein ABEB36_012349 [Hypothenemus hampei]|uniref:Uncharacterized protein n=1 Tax=Hypothenemus hampei TaxID=57062 RepID=A0ABD1ECW5_HYPHA
MIKFSIKPVSIKQGLVGKLLQRFYSASTSIQPAEKEFSENYDKEMKKFETLTNISKRTREKKPQRNPFVKNLTIGIFDNEILTFPEMQLQEVRNIEKQVADLKKLLHQKHMVNVNSISNKNFRQNLADHKALGLQSSQFLDARECCPLELMRYLDVLSEHQLKDSLIQQEMLGAQTLNKFANESLQKKYLHSIITGEKVVAFALNEHNLIDILNMNTTAKLSEDKKSWILNGTKSFVANGISADFFIVIAVSERALLHEEQVSQLSAFIVDKDSKGVSWKKIEPTDFELAEISFDNVEIPIENVIGKVNEADKILRGIMSDFKLSCGPSCNAISKKTIDKLFQFFVEKSYENFDWLSTDAIRIKLGEIAMEYYVADSVTYLTAGLQDWYSNQDVEVESAIVKILSSEAAYRISSICLDIVGLPATLKNHWARQFHEETLNYLTLHESNDSQKLFIAANGLQHAGQNITNRIKMLRNPLHFSTFWLKNLLFDGGQQNDNPKLDFDLAGHLHPSCNGPSKQLEYCVKRLQFATEILLTRHGIECLNKHGDLRSLANILIDCYAMTAVLARASRSYCIGLQFADFEIVLASVFCNRAVDRVKENVNNIYYTEHKANDRNYLALGKRLVESKGYFISNATSRFF